MRFLVLIKEFESYSDEELLTEISLGKVSTTLMMTKLLSQVSKYKDKQNREIKIPHDIPTEGKVVTGVEDESKHQSMSSDQVLSKGGRRPH